MTVTLEEKAVRRVRTQAGADKYGQPIGSIIVRDGKTPLTNLRLGEKLYDATEHVEGSDGVGYELGYDEEDHGWFAITTDDLWDDYAVRYAKNEEEALTLLDKAVGKKRKRNDPALFGSMSGLDDEDQQRSLKDELESRAAALKDYADKRKKDHIPEVATALADYRKEKHDPELSIEHIEKAEEAVRGRKRQEAIRERSAAQIKPPTKKVSKREQTRIAKEKATSAQVHVDKHNAALQKTLDNRMAHNQRRIDKIEQYATPGSLVREHLKAYKDHNDAHRTSDLPIRIQQLEVAESYLKQAENAAEFAKQKRESEAGQRLAVGDHVESEFGRGRVVAHTGRSVTVEYTNGEKINTVVGTPGYDRLKKLDAKSKKIGGYDVTLVSQNVDATGYTTVVEHDGVRYEIHTPKQHTLFDREVRVTNQDSGEVSTAPLRALQNAQGDYPAQTPDSTVRVTEMNKATSEAFKKAMTRDRRAKVNETPPILDRDDDKIIGFLKTEQQRATAQRLVTAINKGNHKEARRELTALKNQVQADGARRGIVAQLREFDGKVEALKVKKDEPAKPQAVRNGNQYTITFPDGSTVTRTSNRPMTHALIRRNKKYSETEDDPKYFVTLASDKDKAEKESRVYAHMRDYTEIVEIADAVTKPNSASDDKREVDYGPLVVGDRVIIDAPTAVGKAKGNRKKVHGLEGEVTKATKNYVTVRTDDGGLWQLPRPIVKKNNSGTRKVSPS